MAVLAAPGLARLPLSSACWATMVCRWTASRSRRATRPWCVGVCWYCSRRWAALPRLASGDLFSLPYLALDALDAHALAGEALALDKPILSLTPEELASLKLQPASLARLEAVRAALAGLDASAPLNERVEQGLAALGAFEVVLETSSRLYGGGSIAISEDKNILHKVR